jgi:2-dehydro-3-deoxyphosphogluconate aldolase/(4S)-4-hydroxy-2-oxoglutarate aldolase
MVRSLLGPLPHLRIIPTGGVTVDSCGAFLKAGCVAVAAGTSMLPADLLEAGDWRRLTEKARKFVSAMAVARGRA